jgi:hypothetical protein
MAHHGSTIEHEQPQAIEAQPMLFALLAEYQTVDDVVAAAERVRDAGYKRWDVHSPFPIHGIDHHMGIRPTILPWIVLACGLAGLGGGFFLVWWTNATTVAGVPTVFQGYEYFISGKPLFSLPANIPVIFETTVLLAAFGAVFGMFFLNKLPMLYNPLFRKARFRRASDDRFFIVIEAADREFDRQKTETLLRETGASVVEEVED